MASPRDGSRPIVPGSSERYAISTAFAGEPIEFEVAFSERLSRALAHDAVRVDLARGEFVFSDHSRRDVTACRAELERLTRQCAPPFVFRWPDGARPFVVPKSLLMLDLDEKTGLVSFDVPDACTPVFTCLTAPYRGLSPRYDESAFVPLGDAYTPRRRELAPGVHLSSSSESDAAAAADAFFSVCGSAWASSTSRRHPLELVVVPHAKHFSALPEVASLRASLLAPARSRDSHGHGFSSSAPYHAATVLVRSRRFVFLPADDLAHGQYSVRHELYHVLEDELLSPRLRERIDALYARVVGRAGPFARPYGFLRHEFFSTMGEVFEGAYGDLGRAWLHEHHRELAGLLAYVTGRAGAANDDVEVACQR